MPRLTILNESEQHEYEYPPALSAEEKTICFAMDAVLAKTIKSLHGATSKIGFLLQYAYFKASRRFFIAKRYRLEDIEYAAKLLGVSLSRVHLEKYKERTLKNHQAKILTFFQYNAYSEQKAWVDQEIMLR